MTVLATPSASVAAGAVGGTVLGGVGGSLGPAAAYGTLLGGEGATEEEAYGVCLGE